MRRFHLGRCKVTVADLFEVEDRGEREIAVRGAESEITLRRSNDRLCAIGEGMSESA